MSSKKRSTASIVWHWVIGIVIFVCISIATGWHFFKNDLAKPHSKIAKPLMIEQLKKMLYDASDGLYKLHYSKFDLDINAGTGLMTGLTLSPDSIILQQLIARQNAPNNLFIFKIDSLRLRNFGFADTKAGRVFTMGNIVVFHPAIKIINKRRMNGDTSKKTSLLLKLALKMFNRFTIKDIAVKNMSLVYLNENDNKHTALNNLDVHVAGLSVDTGLKISLLQFSTPDSLYHINLDGIQVSKIDRTMVIRRTTIEPRLSKQAFYRKVRYDKDRIHMVFNT